jgi:hypothetical protein
MQDAQAAVQKILGQGVVLRVRLRGQATRDVLDVLPLDLPAISHLSPSAVVAALVCLEQRGVVRRVSETVHPHDSSEYWVTWCMVQGTTSDLGSKG